MTKEEFKNLIKEFREQDERVDILNQVFRDSYASDIIEFGFMMFDQVIKASFTTEGQDWINWYLYEKRGDPTMKAFDENNNEIPTETIDDLWNLIEKYVKQTISFK